ncbi:MAG: endonuclease [Candidatus Cloacimonetes bacterium]|nr:endonuclease [Candidatus Cloacimonadota bacterium]
MKRNLILIAFALLSIGLIFGQVPFTATYTFDGTTGNVESFIYNGTTYDGIEMGNLIKVGVTSTSSTGNFRANNWPLGATDGSDVFTGTVDFDKYFGFSITAGTGYEFTVNSITFGIGRSSTGIRQSQWRGSHDNFASILSDYTTLNASLTNDAGVLTNPDLNSSWTGNVLALGTNYANIDTSVGFRFYLYNAESTAGTAGFQGPLTISGTLVYTAGEMVAMPEFNPPAGTYSTPQNISITSDTISATVYYRFDEADPWTEYTSALYIDETTTIWAYATATGMVDSPVNSATYILPTTTDIPYIETFDTDLGDCYTYSVSGDTRFWTHGSYGGNGYAYMNGYNSGDLEEDWLILPGITLNNDDMIMNFETWRRYGSDDVDNYFKLMYSTDYPGIGDPSLANWTEITFTQPASDQVWTSSGNLDLSGIIGDPVYFGFKYHYNFGFYVSWQVDNINIYPSATPLIHINPATLSGFTYYSGQGPSDEQFFTVSGENLAENITITAPLNYEISETSGVGYTDIISLGQLSGIVPDTDIYVRLKADLGVGIYDNEIITLTSSDAITREVVCNGQVLEMPSDPLYITSSDYAYSQDFNSLAISGSGNPWSDNETIFGWYWYSPSDRDPNTYGYIADPGSSNTAAGHSYGSDDSTDRAMGVLSGSGRDFYIGVQFKNDSQETINLSDILVSYTGEQWRQTSYIQTLEFAYMISESLILDFTSGTWIENIALDFAALHTGTDGALDGNLSINSTNFANIPLDIVGVLNPGEYVMLRWLKTGTFSPGLAIDDFSLIIGEPASYLTAVPQSLSDFYYFVNSGPSDPQSFVLEGFYLDGTDVTIEAPTNFAVSIDNTNFDSMVTLIGYTGTATEIWVHLVEGLPIDEYYGDIIIIGGGADSIMVALSGNVYEVIDDFAIPYENPFRTNDDYMRAVFQGFSIENAQQELGAGGYLRIFPDGYLETPTIDFTQYDFLDIIFDGTTYGGALEQTLTVKVSADDGLTYDIIESFALTGTYQTYSTHIDLSDIYNVISGKLKVEMTAGGGSSRLRDYFIGEDYYGPVEGLIGMDLWYGLQAIISDGHLDYSYDAARFYMHGYIDNIDGFVRCIYTGEWVEHPYGSLSTPPEFSAEHTYPVSWYEADLDAQGISFAVSDLHALHPARLDVNSARSNSPFDYVTNIYTIWGSDSYISYTGFNAELEEVFDVADEFKGNIARGIFYFAVRYYVDNDNFYRINVDQLPILLQWHYEDPVDATEILRNEKVFAYQGNRNPFIDRPEFVDLIWGEISPQAPVATLPTDITGNSFTANWNEVTGAVTYRLDVSTSSNFVGFVDGYKNLIVNDTSKEVIGLEGLTTYHYRVRAIDIDGGLSPNSNTIYAATEAPPIEADLIYYWNFNDNVPESGVNWTQPIPANLGDAEITYTFLNAVSFTGTTINGIDGEVNGGSFVPQGGTDNINNGEHFTMFVPTPGYEDIILSYPTRRTSTGFNTQEIQYTIDGENWLTKEVVDITGFENNWLSSQLIIIDFSEIIGVNNNDDFAIRIILDGASSNVGNNRFDNIRVMGTPISGLLLPPENVTIQISGDDVIISWDTDTLATTYRVEGSTDPYTGYIDVTADGVLDIGLETSTWTGVITEQMKFYRVIAVQ